MAQINNVYRESLPALRLIGKRYTDLDRGPLGGFGLKWDEWFHHGYHLPLFRLGPLAENAFIGGMRYQNGFEYWTGMFFPEGTQVPENYQYVDIPSGDIGVCWLHGRASSGELYGEYIHNLCMNKFSEEGWQVAENPWFFERYVNPRFSQPDTDGKVILDYCIYLK